MATRHRFLIGGRVRTVTVDDSGGRLAVAIDDGDPIAVDVAISGLPGTLSLLIDGQPHTAYVARQGAGYEVVVEGRRFPIAPAVLGGRQRGAVGVKDTLGHVTAPLAGVVIAVHVQVGDAVTVGQALLVIEAMKMQNEIQAPHAGTITAIHCQPAGRVERGALVVEYELAAG